MPVGFFLQIVAGPQSEHGRNRAARVPGHEQVELGFVRVRITHQPAAGADRAELRIAARDQLVWIDLVPGVPDQPVARKIETQVQRQAQLDDAKVRGEVGRPDAEHAHQFVAHLLGQLVKLGVRERVEIGGRSNPR